MPETPKKRRSFFDLNDKFYEPLWIRIAIVGFSGAWGLFEFMAGAPFWGVLFAAIAVYAFYGLFIAFDPHEATEENTDKE
jgi:hypothetical protein